MSSLIDDVLNAIFDRDIGRLRFLIEERGASVDCILDDRGTTPLSCATHFQHVDAARFLLEKGANINAVNVNGDTALHIAVILQNRELVQLLLENRANTELPRYVPVKVDNKPSTKILTYWPLSIACTHNNVEIASMLIACGANVNVGNPMKQETPLMKSIFKRNADLVRLLLDSGAEMVARNECEDNTDPLVFALMLKRYEIARLLVDHGGVSVDHLIRGLTTPLTCMARWGYIDEARFLLTKEMGADVNLPDVRGRTPLAIASEHGHTSVVQLLLKKKANIFTFDMNGDTPLAKAFDNGHWDVLFLLNREAPQVWPGLMSVFSR